MNIWQRKGRGGWWAAVLAGWCLLGGARAAEPLIRVPPWFSHSAVIPPGFGSQLGAILLAGEVQAGYKVRVSASIWPEAEIKPSDELGDGPRAKSRAKWAQWALVRRNLSERESSALEGASCFDVTLQPMQDGRGKKSDRLVLTNLCLGPVWIMFVEPDLDNHDLPTLSEAVRRRVRVLVMPNGLAANSSARWMTAAEAEARGESMFCGQPRDFANRLVQAEGESSAPLGLILVPSRDRPATGMSVSLTDVSRASADCPPASHRDYHAGFAAALDVTSKDEPGTAEFRRRQFEADGRRRLVDLKREGLLAPSWIPRHRWTRISTCQDKSGNFRVTGRLW